MSNKGKLPYSRDGLSSRSIHNEQHLQSVRVDPIQNDLDNEILGLRDKVHQLRTVAQVIETETKYQNDLISQLENTVAKAQAGLKSTMKRLNRSVVQNGSNHLTHVFLFLLLCVLFIIIWSKFFRR